MPDHRQNFRPTSLIKWMIGWAMLLAMYLLYTNNVGWREWVAGVVVTSVSVAGAYVFHCAAPMRFRFRMADLLQGGRLPWYILCETLRVHSAAMFRLVSKKTAHGGLYATPYRQVGDDSLSGGRRALAVFYTTTTPNSVVLGIDRKHRLMLYHQVSPGKVSTMTRKLGAE